MAQWMDKITDKIRRQAADAQKQETIMQSSGNLYTELEQAVRTQVDEINQRFFQGHTIFQFGYEDDQPTQLHFSVRKVTVPALKAVLHYSPDDPSFTIFFFEKANTLDAKFEQFAQAELKVSTDIHGTPKLVQGQTIVPVHDAAGLMLGPLVEKALNLK